jgi:hypothetical protein
MFIGQENRVGGDIVMHCETSPFRASNRDALHINWTLSSAFALKQVQSAAQIDKRTREEEK